MSNKIDQKAEGVYLTPSTRKLMRLREGKGPGMLNAEEIELLRMSNREISIASQIAFQSLSDRADCPKFVGLLSDKTNYIATIEEIEQAIQDGWAKDELNRNK